MIFDKFRRLTDYERKIIANVRDYGCHITSVASAIDEEWEPPFSYSTGFIATVGQPEVIVFGLDGKLCASMINMLLDMCRDGLMLADGIEIEDLLDGHRVVAREVTSDRIIREHFNSAIWYEKRRTGRMLDRALQLVWPGAMEGLFPWDEGCSDEVRDFQPALYERSMIS
ncbi:DUF4262 domain-containing protein [Sphingomonas sp. R-74633]|uniref:DUF4262 domain-containing protein n=1 Tax=Sphingomonas sp. R-74633 TaxID=2751188 RepID=UPI0035A19185